jgi:hypothetical protein
MAPRRLTPPGLRHAPGAASSHYRSYLPLRKLMPIVSRRCLLGVCSDVAVPFDSARYKAAAKWAESRTKRHGRALSGSSRTQNSGLLICGFGVQVPGGAPILTWGFAAPGHFSCARFAPMFAPCLLVSSDPAIRGLSKRTRPAPDRGDAPRNRAARPPGRRRPSTARPMV